MTSDVVVPPGHGTGLVAFHGHDDHHRHGHADWAQDWSRTAERTRAEIAPSARHHSHEVRDLLKCAADIRLDVQRNIGVTCTEMAQLKDELTCRMRDDGDKTRDLIRDIDNKRLERELADVKAELMALKHRMHP